MNISRIKNYITAFISCPNILLKKHEYVFLISHMRGYTSLFGHIMGSNPEIVGYYEMHQNFEKEGDYIIAKYKKYLNKEGRLEEKYIFDKILHKSHKINIELALKKQVKFIFLIRPPKETILSNAKMFTETPTEETFKGAAEHYVSQLKYMSSIAEKIGSNAVFIRGEELINNTEIVLTNLTNWLQLKTPLSDKYQTFDKTGTKNYGDPSNNIKAGQILKNRENNEIDIPDFILEEATYIYNESIQKLPNILNDISFKIKEF